MPTELFLITITLAVAVIGVMSTKEMSDKAKYTLAALAVFASAGSVVQAVRNEQDKEFLRTALASTLVPANSDYQKFYGEMGALAAKEGYDAEDYPCHHSPDGFTCFATNRQQTKYGAIVFNKSDVGTMYANIMRNETNRAIINKALVTPYKPLINDEEFLDKIAIVGTDVFYNMYGRFPSNSTYDPSFGVRVYFDKNGTVVPPVAIEPSDISKLPSGKPPEVFHAVEQLFRERFAAAMK